MYEELSKNSWTETVKFLTNMQAFDELYFGKDTHTFYKYYQFPRKTLRNEMNVTFYRIKGIGRW